MQVYQKNKIRMHSSRMRTGRSLTVCCSLLPGGEGGVCSGGVCLLWGGVCSGGVPGLGCVSAPGGSAHGGWVSQHALRQTPPLWADTPLVDRHTLVKILPWPNFGAAGKNSDLKRQKNIQNILKFS